MIIRKYGSPHRQVRALVILDGLIQNAGAKFQRAFADEPLLERLRLMARDETVDPRVRQKCKILFAQWADAYKTTPGLERIANLYKEFPKTQRPAAARQKVLQDTGAEADTTESPFAEAQPRSRSNSHQKPTQATPSRPVTLTPTSSSLSSRLFKDKKTSGHQKSFSLSREKDNMTNAIAQASIASTNLLNGLQLVNRENERISENAEVVRRFQACKSLRRKILYYIQHVESDEWIGSLVNANDELVKALTAYEIMDRSISDDSDSDGWEESQRPSAGSSVSAGTTRQLAGLSLAEEAPPAKPPRPSTIPMPPPPAVTTHKMTNDAADDDDPFGDSNAVQTPFNEAGGMTWREV